MGRESQVSARFFVQKTVSRRANRTEREFQTCPVAAARSQNAQTVCTYGELGYIYVTVHSISDHKEFEVLIRIPAWMSFRHRATDTLHASTHNVIVRPLALFLLFLVPLHIVTLLCRVPADSLRLLVYIGLRFADFHAC